MRGQLKLDRWLPFQAEQGEFFRFQLTDLEPMTASS
jgi:hypothetical protein